MSKDQESAPEEPVVLIESESLPGAMSTSAGMLGENDTLLALTSAKHVALDAFLRLLTRDLAFNDFVREMLLIFVQVVRVEAGSVLELNHNEGALFFRSAYGHISDRITQFSLPMNKGIAGHVVESRIAIRVNNADANEMHVKAIGTLLGFECRNLAAIPLLVRGKVFGVLELLNREGEKEFNEEDMELLRYLAEMAGKLLEIRMMIASVKAPFIKGQTAA